MDAVETTASRRVYIFVALFLLIPVILIVVVLLPDRLIYASKFNAGNKAVSRVESFKRNRGRLPEALDEVGIEDSESSQVHYTRQSATEYTVWFGTTLGDCMTYDSRSEKWEGICVVVPTTND